MSDRRPWCFERYTFCAIVKATITIVLLLSVVVLAVLACCGLKAPPEFLVGALTTGLGTALHGYFQQRDGPARAPYKRPDKRPDT